MSVSETETAEAAARILQLEQHVQQLQSEANIARALEYRCQGLHQDKQQLTQHLQQLKGNVTQMQAALHQERLQRREQTALCARLDDDKQQLLHTCRELEAKLKEAEGLAINAREAQYRAEQDLASAGSGQHVLPSEAQATIPQPAGAGGLQSTAKDLQIKLARADSACASSNAELTAANQCIQQLEQSNRVQVPVFDRQQQGGAGQSNPNRASDNISELSSSSGIQLLPSAAASDSSVSTHEGIVQKMKGQMTGLKASRDKLLAEVDRQSREIERLLYHNATLEQGMSQLKQSATRWEAQAQDSLLQLDQLKGLLEESAFWQPQAPSSSTSGNPLSHRDESTPSETELQRNVLKEKARATNLEVQVRALSLELTKSRERAGALSMSLAPALGEVESRLAQLLQGGLGLSTPSNDHDTSDDV
ncbi:hypothetical protein ABBQ38_002498 [Trebouxia sp. C0009 RCD-2024]